MSDEFIAAGRIVDFHEGKLRKVEIAAEDEVVANIEGRYARSQTAVLIGALHSRRGNSKGPWLSVLDM